MFSKAIAWAWTQANPVKGIKRYTEEKRERFLSVDEMNRLSDALAEQQNLVAANAIRFILLTGCRKTEALTATWDQIDFDTGVWTKPSAHTKQNKIHRLPLSDQAIALLRNIKASHPESSFLFPGRIPGHPLQELRKFWVRVCRQAGLEGVRIHDLRHTYASQLVSIGESIYTVGKLLGHTQTQSTARYSHVEQEALRDAANKFPQLGKQQRDKSAPPPEDLPNAETPDPAPVSIADRRK